MKKIFNSFNEINECTILEKNDNNFSFMSISKLKIYEDNSIYNFCITIFTHLIFLQHKIIVYFYLTTVLFICGNTTNIYVTGNVDI